MPMMKIWNDLLNLFFPNRCLLCHRLLVEGEERICLYCLCQLPVARAQDLQQENPVTERLFDNPRICHASSFLHFQKDDSVQQLIHALKYYGDKELGYLLGRMAARELQAIDHPICRVDYLIPVPLHPKKQRKRGYNQAEWIARGIQSVWNIPICPDALRRVSHRESQTQQEGFKRWDNVKEIFQSTNPSEFAGKHVLIVDDVITTGATIGACAETLSGIPKIRISLFSLAFA